MLKVGIVGVRGLSTLLGFRAMADVEITALCDLDEALLAERSKKHGIGKTYRIYEDMLESDIDAVVIATPMQCHVPQAIAALEAGKHVLSEVTAGVTMDELWWLKEAVEKSGKTYMYAENYCYTPEVQLVRALVDMGKFGEVYYGDGEYLHNVSDWVTQDNGRSNWRKYWQLGKRGAFYPTHSIGPVMQWFAGDRIQSISAFSSGHHNTLGLRQDDTTLVMCQLASGKLVRIRVDCMSNRPHNMTGYALQGTLGSFESAREGGGRNLIWLDEGNGEKAQWRDLMDYKEFLPERYQTATEEQRGAGHGGGDFFLVADFVNAIRTGKTPDIGIAEACEWTAVGLLSELSVMNGGRCIDMPNFRTAKTIGEQALRL